MAVLTPTSAPPPARGPLSLKRDGGPPPLAVTADKQRRTWIDATRGAAIFLVVVGHTVRGLFNAHILASEGPWGFVDRWIYAFHMPLFFFLSGLFTLPGKDEPYATFAKKRLVRLGYPYLLWATLQTLVQVVLSRYTNRPTQLSDLWRIAFEPPMQFWFLYALFLQVLVIGALWKLGVPRVGIFLVGLALYLVGPYLSMGTWLPLYQARDGLVYTGLGVMLGEGARLRTLERRKGGEYVAVAVLGLALVTAGVWLRLEEHFLWALGLALCGSAGLLALGLLLERAPGAALARLRDHIVLWGAASLAIFVAHTLASAAARIALQKVLHIENAPLHLVAGMAVGIYVPLVLYVASRRYDLPYLFEWPTRPRARISKAPGAPVTPSPRA
ncbi:MAG: acyltransferase [Polyangiales bacterium]